MTYSLRQSYAWTCIWLVRSILTAACPGEGSEEDNTDNLQPLPHSVTEVTAKSEERDDFNKFATENDLKAGPDKTAQLDLNTCAGQCHEPRESVICNRLAVVVNPRIGCRMERMEFISAARKLFESAEADNNTTGAALMLIPMVNIKADANTLGNYNPSLPAQLELLRRGSVVDVATSSPSDTLTFRWRSSNLRKLLPLRFDVSLGRPTLSL